MTYRLWLGDLDCGVAADQHARNWKQAIEERYPGENVHIEPAPGAPPTFPVGADDHDEPDLTRVTSAQCPHCKTVKVIPGFDRMLAFTCANCGAAVKVTLPVV